MTFLLHICYVECSFDRMQCGLKPMENGVISQGVYVFILLAGIDIEKSAMKSSSVAFHMKAIIEQCFPVMLFVFDIFPNKDHAKTQGKKIRHSFKEVDS